jgi:hypothetical protein
VSSSRQLDYNKLILHNSGVNCGYFIPSLVVSDISYPQFTEDDSAILQSLQSQNDSFPSEFEKKLVLFQSFIDQEPQL